ncbi:glutaredoxin family protein [Massilia sp. W12]|uniref:glutaredoxin family protein n=1 Tax=Massilia sp. W12 TaxID=3126507 RepID=UPI0030D2AAB0
MKQLILYSRSYCHLCHEMEQALRAQFDLSGVRLEVRDVDADEQAVARWDELVPVLLALQADGQERELCHYFLDAAAVASWLQE